VLLVVVEGLGTQQKAATRTIERIRHKPVLLDEFDRGVSGRDSVREAALEESDLVVLVFSSSLDVEERDLLDQGNRVGIGLLCMHVIELLHGWRWEDYKPKRRGPKAAVRATGLLRSVLGEDKVASFFLRVAGKAGFHLHLGAGLAVFEATKPPPARRGVLH
jgi:hypothetical protein